MTLAIMLVTPGGVWCSTDHQLTKGGRPHRDDSVKHLQITCHDGYALIGYGGIGEAPGQDLDISEWARRVLRGKSRSIDESLVDIREQATATLGSIAYRQKIPHAFLVGAYYGGRPWAILISNWRVPSPGGRPVLLPRFETAADRADDTYLLVTGGGMHDIGADDRKMLLAIGKKVPRQPDGYMKLLAGVNRRASVKRPPDKRTISESCTVTYMPAAGAPTKSQWYGPEKDTPQAIGGFSSMWHGLDMGELFNPAEFELLRLKEEGLITEEEYKSRSDGFCKESVTPRGRRALRSP